MGMNPRVAVAYFGLECRDRSKNKLDALHTSCNSGRHMQEAHLAGLEKVGLSSAEAQIYLALLRNAAPMGASAVVAATGVPRSSVYPILTHLTDRGLLEAEAGYGGRFSAISAE